MNEEQDIKTLFKEFYKNYTYIKFDEIIDYFSIFGGIDNLDLIDGIDSAIKDLIINREANNYFPFFLLSDPFRKFLITMARGDGKLYSIYNKIRVGHSLGDDILKELIKSDVVYIVNSREEPLKQYEKQLIKKELRGYKIEPKVFFKKPFYRFWFLFVEPYIENLDIDKLLFNFHEKRYRLASLVFEQLSIELLKLSFQKDTKIIEIASYWDRFSEFDILAKSMDGSLTLGECKYKNRPVIKSELLKLKNKAINSNLEIQRFALFSKSGFSSELHRLNDKDLYLFELKDYKKLLN